jgi:hypothetical protein
MAQVCFIVAMLTIVFYYAFLSSNFQLPASFCAGGSLMRRKFGRFTFIPNIVLAIITACMVPPALLIISHVTTCLLLQFLLYCIAAVTFISFMFVACTIGVNKVSSIHEILGTAGESFLWLWAILVSFYFGTVLMSLATIGIIFSLHSIHKEQSRKMMRYLFWREVAAYAVYFVTNACILAIL